MLAKVTLVKIVNYGSSVYDYISGDVAAFIVRVLVDACMLHCSGADCLLSTTNNKLPEDGVTAPKHVRAFFIITNLIH